jgi:hypothetical protein
MAWQERIRNKLRESILMLCRDRRGEGDDEPIPAVETDEVVRILLRVFHDDAAVAAHSTATVPYGFGADKLRLWSYRRLVYRSATVSSRVGSRSRYH